MTAHGGMPSDFVGDEPKPRTYRYDQHGNVVSGTIGTDSSANIRYEYDSAGNVLKIFGQNRDGSPLLGRENTYSGGLLRSSNHIEDSGVPTGMADRPKE